MGVGVSDDFVLDSIASSTTGFACDSALVLSCSSFSSLTASPSGGGGGSTGRSFHLAGKVEKALRDAGLVREGQRACCGEVVNIEAGRAGVEACEKSRLVDEALRTLNLVAREASLHGRFCPYNIFTM